METDADLLRRFVKNRDEAAFNELVRKHVDLVYSAALRQLAGDFQLAEDAAQMVFADLWRKAPSLRSEPVLGGWLYSATRFTTSKLVRAERRRKAREEAYAMDTLNAEHDAEWEQLAPILDAALGDLHAADRNAVILRFFEKKAMREIGLVLGIGEDAAQKRISRALETLRSIITRRGLSTTTAALALQLTANAVQAAPASLPHQISIKAAATGLSMTRSGQLWELIRQASATKLVIGSVLVVVLVTAVVFNISGGSTGVPADLASYYNGNLEVCWVPGFDPGNHLGSFPYGRHSFRGVTFDVRGVVQLQGQEWRKQGHSFPERIEGVPVTNRVRRIHVLHGNSAFEDPPATTVAWLVIHYADGSEARLPIQQGENILDWWRWRDTKPQDPNTKIAWTGQNPATKARGLKVRICQTAFENPYPDKVLQSVDYVSAMAGSAPFVLGMTFEKL